jgi:hypothetical protein
VIPRDGFRGTGEVTTTANALHPQRLDGLGSTKDKWPTRHRKKMSPVPREEFGSVHRGATDARSPTAQQAISQRIHSWVSIRSLTMVDDPGGVQRNEVIA